MNLADRERIEAQLVAFCLRVIENEARNIHFMHILKIFFKIVGVVLLQNKKHIHLTDIICP